MAYIYGVKKETRKGKVVRVVKRKVKTTKDFIESSGFITQICCSKEVKCMELLNIFEKYLKNNHHQLRFKYQRDYMENLLMVVREVSKWEKELLLDFDEYAR